MIGLVSGSLTLSAFQQEPNIMQHIAINNTVLQKKKVLSSERFPSIRVVDDP